MHGIKRHCVEEANSTYKIVDTYYRRDNLWTAWLIQLKGNTKYQALQIPDNPMENANSFNDYAIEAAPKLNKNSK